MIGPEVMILIIVECARGEVFAFFFLRRIGTFRKDENTEVL